MEDLEPPKEDLTQDSVSSKPAKCDAIGCIGSNQFAQWTSYQANVCTKFVYKEYHHCMLDCNHITPFTDPLTSKVLFVCS